MKTSCFFLAVLLLCCRVAGQPDASSNSEARQRTSPPVSIPTPATNSSIPKIALENTDIGPVLRLYAEITARTVLLSPNIRRISFSLHSEATNRVDVARLIEKALADQGIVTIPDGDKFVLVVLQTEVAKAKPRSMEIEALPATLRERELSPVGTVNFNADIHEVVRIYAGLVGRKLDGSETPFLRGRQIVFKSQTPLLKEELLYALDTLFEWHGFRLVPGDGNSLKAVAFPEK